MLVAHFSCAVNKFAIWVTHSWSRKIKGRAIALPLVVLEVRLVLPNALSTHLMQFVFMQHRLLVPRDVCDLL